MYSIHGRKSEIFFLVYRHDGAKIKQVNNLFGEASSRFFLKLRPITPLSRL